MGQKQQMVSELKDQLKICYGKLAVLEQPIRITAYDRNEVSTLNKKKCIEEEIKQLKQQIKNLQ